MFTSHMTEKNISTSVSLQKPGKGKVCILTHNFTPDHYVMWVANLADI